MGTNFNRQSTEYGIIQLSLVYIFNKIKSLKGEGCDFIISGSFVEMYHEELVDLLDNKTKNKSIVIKDYNNSVVIQGIKEINICDVDDALKYLYFNFSVLWTGSLNRKTASTNYNKESSRSHAVFILNFERIDKFLNKTKFKLNFIDLAGSENTKHTGTTSEERLKESIAINTGLLSLSKVIMSLAKESRHIPYRDSKLTRILKDSLNGNSVTVMFACISPSEINRVETINTLSYASFAKGIKIKPERKGSICSTTNGEYDSLADKTITLMNDEICRLKNVVKSLRSNSFMSEPDEIFDDLLDENIIEIEYSNKTKENIELKNELIDIKKELETYKSKEIEMKSKLYNFEKLLERKITYQTKTLKYSPSSINGQKNNLKTKHEKTKPNLSQGLNTKIVNNKIAYLRKSQNVYTQNMPISRNKTPTPINKLKLSPEKQNVITGVETLKVLLNKIEHTALQKSELENKLYNVDKEEREYLAVINPTVFNLQTKLETLEKVKSDSETSILMINNESFDKKRLLQKLKFTIAKINCIQAKIEKLSTNRKNTLDDIMKNKNNIHEKINKLTQDMLTLKQRIASGDYVKDSNPKINCVVKSFNNRQAEKNEVEDKLINNQLDNVNKAKKIEKLERYIKDKFSRANSYNFNTLESDYPHHNGNISQDIASSDLSIDNSIIKSKKNISLYNSDKKTKRNYIFILDTIESSINELSSYRDSEEKL
jgi:hypothetical protein